jgi:cell division protein FtsW
MKLSSINYNILVAVSILLVLGTLCIADISAPFSLKVYGNTYHIFIRYFFHIFFGILGAFLCFKTPIDKIKKNIEYIVLVIVVLMFLVFIPGLGINAGGASRWLNLGFTSIQPSEFFKLAFIIFLAKKLSSQRIRDLGDLMRMIGVFTLLCIPIGIQRDMSTLMVMSAIFGTMYLLADTPIRHAVWMVIFGLIIAFLLIRFEPYRMQRIEMMINPDLDPMGAGWQQKQSLISIGSGGITGVGLGQSKQKMGFLPQPMTDSVFALIGEQLGFLGCTGIIFLYLFLLWQGFKTAKNARSDFMRLMSYGIVVWIIGQAFVNIGSAVGLFPVTGLPLPFISYGGSSMIASLMGIGLLLNVSKQLI